MKEVTPRTDLRDRVSQKIIKLTGDSHAIDSNHWLHGPYGKGRKIGQEFFKALADKDGKECVVNAPESGILSDFGKLQNSDFDPNLVDKTIVDFYEHTSLYRLDLHSTWAKPVLPLAKMLQGLFTKRLQQMNIPTNKENQGDIITSDIQQIIDPTTQTVEQTGWVRTNQASGSVLYVGAYSLCRLESGMNAVKVVFPLPESNASVLLKPHNGAEGSFHLVSSGQALGDPGFYLVTKDQKTEGRAHVRFVKNLKQKISVYRDKKDRGSLLTTDHSFAFGNREFLKLKYNIYPKSSH